MGIDHGCNVVANIDTDNIVTGNYLLVLLQELEKGCTAMHSRAEDQWNRNGTCGRIACSALRFQTMRGYDELMFGA
eukprot:1231939-Amphidinium_carterae.1